MQSVEVKLEHIHAMEKGNRAELIVHVQKWLLGPIIESTNGGPIF